MTLVVVTWIALELGRAQTPVAYAQEQPKPVQISVVAVKAVRDGRKPVYMDAAIPKRCHGALKPLRYDAYFKLQTADMPLPFNREQEIYLTKKYSLNVTPIDHDAQGRVRLRARIMIKSEDPKTPPKKALDTTVAMVRGKPFNLGGLKVDNGVLIVVLTLK